VVLAVMVVVELTVLLAVQAAGVNLVGVLAVLEILLLQAQVKVITEVALQQQVVIILLVVEVGQARLVELHLQIRLMLVMAVMVLQAL
jgi:hypothetical protein